MRPGRGFDGGQDFGEFLRRELHAAADQVEPGADGLEQIREKIRSRSAHASQHHGVRAVWPAILGFLGLAPPARNGPPLNTARRNGTGAKRCSGRPSPLA